MCGITGIICNQPTDQNTTRPVALNMTAALRHRGPDGWGIYSSPQCTLTHTRLAVIDLPGGNQPMITDRYVISFNGEIFNYIELKNDLIKRGVHFRTHSDTEVIIKTIETFGPTGIRQFNGQFAFLLWDKVEKQLLICRDRYGMQPLYVLDHEGKTYFASEMKAFDCIPGYKREFDFNNLLLHGLLWNTLGDTTVYKGIRSVKNGTYEVYPNRGSCSVFRYYEIGESFSENTTSFHDASEELSALLEDAVKIRLRSDVPVANYLSGGIDSSVITYLTSLHNSKKFHTFSVTFEDSDFDESPFQKEMIQQLGNEHYEERITYSTIDNRFRDVIYHCERPLFRTAPTPLFMLSDAVRKQGYRVVLTGEAADELLYGYDSYKELKLLKFWDRNRTSTLRPTLIKKLYPHLRHFSDSRRYGLMRLYYEGFLDSFNNNLSGLNIRLHNNSVISNYLNKDIPIQIDTQHVTEVVEANLPEAFNSWSLLRKNQFLEMRTLLSGYLLSSQGDRMTMSHGIEARYPFLDHRLVEKIFSFNDNFKLNGFSQKHLLKKAFNNVIPQSIINRPKMPYQAPDLKSFIQNKKMTENASQFLSPESITSYGIFDPKMVERLITKSLTSEREKIGYRDNMLITFILSSQLCRYWAYNPKQYNLDHSLKTIDHTERQDNS